MSEKQRVDPLFDPATPLISKKIYKYKEFRMCFRNDTNLTISETWKKIYFYPNKVKFDRCVSNFRKWFEWTEEEEEAISFEAYYLILNFCFWMEEIACTKDLLLGWVSAWNSKEHKVSKNSRRQPRPKIPADVKTLNFMFDHMAHIDLADFCGYSWNWTKVYRDLFNTDAWAQSQCANSIHSTATGRERCE